MTISYMIVLILLLLPISRRVLVVQGTDRCCPQVAVRCCLLVVVCQGIDQSAMCRVLLVAARCHHCYVGVYFEGLTLAAFYSL